MRAHSRRGRYLSGADEGCLSDGGRKGAAILYFTSDTHFGHAGALGLFGRGFDGIAAMDEALIAAWNHRIGPEDEVWHLGDVAWRPSPERAAQLLSRLNGRKHLIAGNIDNEAMRSCPHWASVADYAELEVEGRRLILCHYPFRSWNGMHKGTINLHGHSHGRLEPLKRQVDVGVDAWSLAPVALAEVLARAAARRRPAKG